MNLLRGDAFWLKNSTLATIGVKGEHLRCKPFKFTYEKEIVLYAHFKKLEYLSLNVALDVCQSFKTNHVLKSFREK